MINLGKTISILFWATVVFIFVAEPNWQMSPIIKVVGIVTINIHFLEAFWFLSWKETAKLENTGLHISQIMVFGAFHLRPLRERLYGSEE